MTPDITSSSSHRIFRPYDKMFQVWPIPRDRVAWSLRMYAKKDMNETIRRQIIDARQCMGCMHEGLIVTSTDGTIVETSPAAERILEAPSLSLKGRQVRDLCPCRDAMTISSGKRTRQAAA